MRRLLQINTIDHLFISLWRAEELALLPFTAQVESLSYEFSASSLSEADVQSLHIVARKFSFVLQQERDERTFPTEAAILFLSRLAELRHFVELMVGFRWPGQRRISRVPQPVVHEVIRVALANFKLMVFDLSDDHLDWGMDLETLCNGLKDHKNCVH
jgi:hypothetical protein